jgi:hypothetical protein
MRTLYLYQMENGRSFTSEDEPTQTDRDCARTGFLRIFRISTPEARPGQCCHHPGPSRVEELVCGEPWSMIATAGARERYVPLAQDWQKLLGSCIKTNEDTPEDGPYHAPLKEDAR